MNYFAEWVVRNWIEIIGTLSGFLYIYFSIKQNIWLWPVGFLTSFAFIFVFAESRLFADMALQIYYCLASMYGWFFWKFGNKKQFTKRESRGELPITRLTYIQWILTIAVTIIITTIYIPIGKIFHASYPLLDGWVTAASIVATWMLARKILDQWLIWIVVDLLSAGMLLTKQKYLAALLMLVYTFLAIIGYIKWSNTYIKAKNEY